MAGNNFKLNFWDETRKDIKKLDGSQMIFVKKGLKRIKEFGLECGQPLHGKLEGYKKLKNRKMGLRIVFGQNPETNEIDIIDIVAIGYRKNLDVYNEAITRVANRNN